MRGLFLCSIVLLLGWRTTPRTDELNTVGLDRRSAIAHLPATIRDAVRVTLALGLRHLWVDALCIFQDDHHDKASDITKMPMIYRNAVVTIAATRAIYFRP